MAKKRKTPPPFCLATAEDGEMFDRGAEKLKKTTWNILTNKTTIELLNITLDLFSGCNCRCHHHCRCRY